MKYAGFQVAYVAWGMHGINVYIYIGIIVQLKRNVPLKAADI